MAPAVDGFFDPGLDALGVGEADDGADFGGFVGGIAGDQLRGDVDEFPEEGLKDAALDENALHRDARLAGVAKGCVRGAERRLRRDRASRRGRSGPRCRRARAATRLRPEWALRSQPTLAEPVKLTSLMRSSLLGEPGGVFVGEGEDGERFLGPTGFEDDFAESQGGEGGLRGGLEEDGAAGGDGGRELVGDEHEREVERGDGQDGADGEALHKAPAAFVALGEIEGDGSRRRGGRLLRRRF